MSTLTTSGRPRRTITKPHRYNNESDKENSARRTNSISTGKKGQYLLKNPPADSPPITESASHRRKTTIARSRCDSDTDEEPSARRRKITSEEPTGRRRSHSNSEEEQPPKSISTSRRRRAPHICDSDSEEEPSSNSFNSARCSKTTKPQSSKPSTVRRSHSDSEEERPSDSEEFSSSESECSPLPSPSSSDTEPEYIPSNRSTRKRKKKHKNGSTHSSAPSKRAKTTDSTPSSESAPSKKAKTTDSTPSAPSPKISTKISAILTTHGSQAIRTEPMTRSSANKPSDLRPTKLRLIQDDIFEFGSTTCNHTNSTDSDADTKCAVMKAYNLEYNQAIKAIICRHHIRVLFPDQLERHLHKFNNNTERWKNVPNHANIRDTRNIKTMDPIVDHLRRHFDLSTQTPQDVTVILDHPIPSLPDPIKYIECPDCKQLSRWDPTGKELTDWVSGKSRPPQRWRLEHKACPRATLFENTSSRYFQMFDLGIPTFDPNEAAEYAIVINPAWVPPDDDDAPPELVSPQPFKFKAVHKQPSYLSKEGSDPLGWREAILGSSPCSDRDRFVISLGRLPSRSKPPGFSDSDYLLEKHLFLVHEFLKKYIGTANEFTASQNKAFRKLLTQRTKNSVYRDLAPETCARYRLIFTRTIAFLVRLKAAEQKGINAFGFTYLISKRTEAVLQKLFKLLADETQEPDPQELAQQVHALLVSLVIAWAPLSTKMGNALDYAIAIESYYGDGLFKDPERLKQLMAATVYGLRSVVVHVSRLGDHKALWAAYQKKEGASEEDNSSLESEMCMEDDEDDEADEDPGIASKRSQGQPPVAVVVNDGFDDEDEEKQLPETPGDVLPFPKVLEKYLAWISPLSGAQAHGTSIFNRVSQIWALARTESKNVIGFSRVHWEEDGQAFLYFNSRMPDAVRFTVENLVSAAQESVARAVKALPLLLPPNYTSAPTSQTDPQIIQLANERCSLMLSGIKDNPMKTHSSLVLQNDSLFSEHSELVWKALHNSFQNSRSSRNGPSFKSSRKSQEIREQQRRWLAKEQDFLELLATAFVLTCGIPPRAFQAVLLLFAASPEDPRNLFLLKGELVLTLPETKSYTKRMKGGLWVIPKELASTLLIYLGIFRCISVTIRKGLDLPGDLSIAESFIFVHVDNNKPWEPTHFSQSLRRCTGAIEHLPIPLDTNSSRQIASAIAEKHFPTTSNANQENVYHRIADHSPEVTNSNYAMDVRPHTGGGPLSDKDASEMIQAGKKWQSSCGLAAPVVGTSLSQNQLSIFRHHSRQEVALYRARALVTAVYGAGFTKSTEEIVRNRPFLGDASCIGDEVLVKVTAAVCFGIECPGTDARVSLDGFSEKLVGEAVSLIYLALAEWEHPDRQRNYDLTSTSTRLLVQKMAAKQQAILRPMKDGRTTQWVEFSKRVHAYANRPPSDPLDSAMFKFDGDGEDTQMEAGNDSMISHEDNCSSEKPAGADDMLPSPRHCSSLPPDSLPSPTHPSQASISVGMANTDSSGFEKEGDIITPDTEIGSLFGSPRPDSPDTASDNDIDSLFGSPRPGSSYAAPVEATIAETVPPSTPRFRRHGALSRNIPISPFAPPPAGETFGSPGPSSTARPSDAMALRERSLSDDDSDDGSTLPAAAVSRGTHVHKSRLKT